MAPAVANGGTAGVPIDRGVRGHERPWDVRFFQVTWLLLIFFPSWEHLPKAALAAPVFNAVLYVAAIGHLDCGAEMEPYGFRRGEVHVVSQRFPPNMSLCPVV